MEQYYEVMLCQCGNPEHTCPRAVVPSLDVEEFDAAIKDGVMKPTDGKQFNRLGRKRLVAAFRAAVSMGRFKLVGSGVHTARGTEV